jgi:hypothetical protein
MAYEAENLVSGIELGAAAILGGVFAGMAQARRQREMDAVLQREQEARLRTAAAGGRERVLRSTIDQLREHLAEAREEAAESEEDRGQLLRLLIELRRENELLRELAVEGV